MKQLAYIVPAICCMAYAASAASGSFLATNPRAPRSENTEATEPYMKTQVQAQLRMNVDKDTEQVHFIRDNNDPYVVTKTYILKHADPYAIRTFVLRAVQANRVTPDNTTVECIKYNDGTGAIIVSAEQYRFNKLKSGMTVDEIVAALDKPNLTSSSGQTTFVYLPKYWKASDLAQEVKNVGANVYGDDVELQFGKDSIQYDNELNAILMYLPRYSQKNVEALLKLYDCPTYEVEIGYKLYEIYAENDAKIGVDFQAWKNNAGADLFSVGGRYRDGWSATWAGGADKSNSSKTGFLNFNPKWNTRYLDFLQSTGKAKVMTQGKLLVMSTTTGSVEVKNNIFNFENGEKIDDKAIVNGVIAVEGNFVTSGTDPDVNGGNYRILAYDSSGNQIDFLNNLGSGKFTVSRIMSGNVPYYVLRLDKSAGTTLVKDGRTFLEGKALSFTMEADGANADGDAVWTEVAWSSDLDLIVQKGYKVDTKAAADDYGFAMTVTPDVNENSTILSLKLTNDSLIGWKSDGSPRIARDTDIETKVVINNTIEKFVIGGMDKRQLVTTVTGVPFLKDLPFLGYLFSSEAPTTKRSQLVLVIECKMQNPDSVVEKKTAAEISSINKKIGPGGDSLPLASQQYFLGRDK